MVARTICWRRTDATPALGVMARWWPMLVGQSTSIAVRRHAPVTISSGPALPRRRRRRGAAGSHLHRVLVGADHHVHVGLLAVADHRELHGLAHRRARDDALQIPRLLDLGAV